MIKNFLTAFVALFVMVFGFATFSFAQTAPGSFPNVKIRNFGQMDERFYRGAQPLPDDFQALKDLGVKTVIDLRNDPTDYEKAAVEALGMRYVNIPMSGWKSPKDRQVEEFLKLANDPETGAFFVHCKAGIHRTGVAGAVWRFTNYGWGYDQAYKEMKNYDFSTGLVHGALKTYV
ncbi:MAG TPA: tyrosine-protein phosphatase, partial [Pyrinomonadaceae bacterium]|nr:tyrosine-protein phosphatase [Pyrinomonadaceae bacterium]